MAKIKGCILKIYDYIEGMKENLDLKDYTEEQLAVLPKVKVVYLSRHNKKKGKNEVTATIFLDAFLKIEFVLEEIEVALLLQHHNLPKFGFRQTFDKEYLLVKGIAAKGTKAERQWYRVDLLVVPGGLHKNYVVRKFIGDAGKLYIQKDHKLNALFQSVA